MADSPQMDNGHMDDNHNNNPENQKPDLSVDPAAQPDDMPPPPDALNVGPGAAGEAVAPPAVANTTDAVQHATDATKHSDLPPPPDALNVGPGAAGEAVAPPAVANTTDAVQHATDATKHSDLPPPPDALNVGPGAAGEAVAPPAVANTTDAVQHATDATKHSDLPPPPDALNVGPGAAGEAVNPANPVEHSEHLATGKETLVDGHPPEGMEELVDVNGELFDKDGKPLEGMEGQHKAQFDAEGNPITDHQVDAEGKPLGEGLAVNPDGSPADVMAVNPDGTPLAPEFAAEMMNGDLPPLDAPIQAVNPDGTPLAPEFAAEMMNGDLPPLNAPIQAVNPDGTPLAPEFAAEMGDQMPLPIDAGAPNTPWNDAAMNPDMPQGEFGAYPAGPQDAYYQPTGPGSHGGPGEHHDGPTKAEFDAFMETGQVPEGVNPPTQEQIDGMKAHFDNPGEGPLDHYQAGPANHFEQGGPQQWHDSSQPQNWDNAPMPGSYNDMPHDAASMQYGPQDHGAYPAGPQDAYYQPTGPGSHGGPGEHHDGPTKAEFDAFMETGQVPEGVNPPTQEQIDGMKAHFDNPGEGPLDHYQAGPANHFEQGGPQQWHDSSQPQDWDNAPMPGSYNDMPHDAASMQYGPQDHGAYPAGPQDAYYQPTGPADHFEQNGPQQWHDSSQPQDWGNAPMPGEYGNIPQDAYYGGPNDHFQGEPGFHGEPGEHHDNGGPTKAEFDAFMETGHVPEGINPPTQEQIDGMKDYFEGGPGFHGAPSGDWSNAPNNHGSWEGDQYQPAAAGDYQGDFGGHQGDFGGHPGDFAGHQGDFGGHPGDFAGHPGENGDWDNSGNHDASHLPGGSNYMDASEGDFGGHQGDFGGHQGDFGGHPGDFGGHQGEYSDFGPAPVGGDFGGHPGDNYQPSEAEIQQFFESGGHDIPEGAHAPSEAEIKSFFDNGGDYNGPHGQFNDGPHDQFNDGPQDQYNNGPQDHYNDGPQDQYNNGPQDQYNNGPQDEHQDNNNDDEYYHNNNFQNENNDNNNNNNQQNNNQNENNNAPSIALSNGALQDGGATLFNIDQSNVGGVNGATEVTVFNPTASTNDIISFNNDNAVMVNGREYEVNGNGGQDLVEIANAENLKVTLRQLLDGKFQAIITEADGNTITNDSEAVNNFTTIDLGSTFNSISVNGIAGGGFDSIGHNNNTLDDDVLGLGNNEAASMTFGSSGNDTINLASGGTINNEAFTTTSNIAVGGDGDDTINGSNIVDVLSGDDGQDTLNGGQGNDTLDGGADNDTLDGGAGNDELNGGANNDSLSGGAGNDQLDGGVGDDSLEGEAGDDTYIFSTGNDTITELGTDGEENTLLFSTDSGIELGDITIAKDGNNLIISHAESSSQTTVLDIFNGSDEIKAGYLSEIGFENNSLTDDNFDLVAGDSLADLQTKIDDNL